MNYILLLLSITMETGKNVISNHFSKNTLKNETDMYKFNFFMYLGSLFVLMCFGFERPSNFTVIMAIFFAISITANQCFFLKALKHGTMSCTNFIQSSSMIIPTVFSVIVWHEKITAFQVIMLFVILITLAIALDIKKGNMNFKWIILSLLAMIFMGAIGIVQSVHQMSAYKNEISPFLRTSFLFIVIINLILWIIYERKEKSNFKVKSSAVINAATSGAFMGGVHIINLYLAGVLPKVIFFPASSGGIIYVTLFVAVIFCKEKLSKAQWISVISGTIALCLLGI